MHTLKATLRITLAMPVCNDSRHVPYIGGVLKWFSDPQLRRQRSTFPRLPCGCDGEDATRIQCRDDAVACYGNVSCRPVRRGRHWLKGARHGKKKATFDDYIKAAMQLVAEFRDELHTETARMMQAKADKPHEFDPAKHAHLHRIRVSSDAFLSALSGQY